MPTGALAACLLLLGAAVPTPSATPLPTSGPYVPLDRIAAVVGDDIILESEVAKLVAVGFLGRLPGETDAQYQNRVLNERIVDILRERQLSKTGGLEPEKAEVEARLQQLVARLEKERGERFDAILARAQVTREEVAAWIRRGLALETYARERISPTIKIEVADLKAFYEGRFRAEWTAGHPGEPLPPFESVEGAIREALREIRLTEEIEKWTEKLKSETRILIYRR